MKEEINSYKLSRDWFNFCFENPEIIRPIHSAIYFFAIEHCNRLGWKDKFGFPSQMVMEAIGVKNWRTYSLALQEIVDFGFIRMIEVSKNQYSSNIIALVKNTKANTKALDKALSKHSQKQHTKHGQSTVSVDKQEETNNKEQKETNNNILLSQVDESTLSPRDKKYYQIAISFFELVKSSLKELNISVAEIENAKFKTWVDPIRLLIENDKRTIDEFREIFSFLQKDEFWKEQIRSTAKLRKKNKDERTYFEVLLEKSRNGQKRKQQFTNNGKQSNSGVSEDYKNSILNRLLND